MLPKIYKQVANIYVTKESDLTWKKEFYDFIFLALLDDLYLIFLCITCR